MGITRPPGPKPNLLDYGMITPDLALHLLWRTRRHLLVWEDYDSANKIQGVINHYFSWPLEAGRF